MPQQIIQDRYIDQNKLHALLVRKFPPSTYSLKWKLNRWIIVAPSPLTDAEIEEVELDIPVQHEMGVEPRDSSRTGP